MEKQCEFEHQDISVNLNRHLRGIATLNGEFCIDTSCITPTAKNKILKALDAGGIKHFTGQAAEVFARVCTAYGLDYMKVTSGVTGSLACTVYNAKLAEELTAVNMLMFSSKEKTHPEYWRYSVYYKDRCKAMSSGGVHKLVVRNWLAKSTYALNSFKKFVHNDPEKVEEAKKFIREGGVLVSKYHTNFY